MLADFKNATHRLNLNIFFMNFSVLHSSIIVVYPLKISLSSDKFYILKTSSIVGQGDLISEALEISRIFYCFHPL